MNFRRSFQKFPESSAAKIKPQKIPGGFFYYTVVWVFFFSHPVIVGFGPGTVSRGKKDGGEIAVKDRKLRGEFVGHRTLGGHRFLDVRGDQLCVS